MKLEELEVVIQEVKARGEDGICLKIQRLYPPRYDMIYVEKMGRGAIVETQKVNEKLFIITAYFQLTDVIKFAEMYRQLVKEDNFNDFKKPKTSENPH